MCGKVRKDSVSLEELMLAHRSCQIFSTAVFPKITSLNHTPQVSRIVRETRICGNLIPRPIRKIYDFSNGPGDEASICRSSHQ